MWRRQRGARRRREMRFLTARALPTGRADSSKGGGETERAGTLFADAGRSVGPRGAPKLGPVSPALFHGEKERLNRNCSTDSRSWFIRCLMLFCRRTLQPSLDGSECRTRHI